MASSSRFWKRLAAAARLLRFGDPLGDFDFGLPCDVLADLSRWKLTVYGRKLTTQRSVYSSIPRRVLSVRIHIQRSNEDSHCDGNAVSKFLGVP